MSEIVVFTGVEIEARALARALDLPALSAPSIPVFGRGGLRVAPIGLRACLLDQRWGLLVNGLHRPLIISAGTCGGLDPDLAPGDLVLPERVLGPSGERLTVTPSSHGAAVSAAGGSGRTGCLVTTREVVQTTAEKAALRARTGAVAVDMESSMIVAAAAAAGCPSLVVRGVSDDASQGLPRELAALLTPHGRLRRARAVALAVTHPATILAAIALRRRSMRALRAVARVLAALAASAGDSGA